MNLGEPRRRDVVAGPVATTSVRARVVDVAARRPRLRRRGRPRRAPLLASVAAAKRGCQSSKRGTYLSLRTVATHRMRRVVRGGGGGAGLPHIVTNAPAHRYAARGRALLTTRRRRGGSMEAAAQEAAVAAEECVRSQWSHSRCIASVWIYDAA